jgi:hypothetical protein
MKHFLRHLFVPHESNNHRSKLLHYDVLLLIIAFLFSGLIVMAGVHRQYPAVLGDEASISTQDLLKYTNIKRQANGLAPLVLNSELSHAASQKAKDMFAKNYWAHVAPDGTTPWVFIKDSGYQYLYAGENLARGFNTSSDVVDAWMKSPTHRENLLSPHYTDIGFAVASGSLTGSDTVLVVQEFGSKYIAKDDEVNASPSSAVAAPVNPSPVQDVPVATDNQASNLAGVAAIQNSPLLDEGMVKRNTSFFFLLLFIGVLVVDAVIIERKKIARVFSHNIDHILFLLFILLAGIIVGRGVIL